MGGPLWTKTEFYNVELGYSYGPVHPVQVRGGFLVPYLDSEAVLPLGAQWKGHTRTAYLALEHEAAATPQQAVETAEQLAFELLLVLSLAQRRPVFYEWTAVYASEDMTGEPTLRSWARIHWEGMPFQREPVMFFPGTRWDFIALRSHPSFGPRPGPGVGSFPTGLPEFVPCGLENVRQARESGQPLHIPILLHLDAILAPVHAEVRVLLHWTALEALAARRTRLSRPEWNNAKDRVKGLFPKRAEDVYKVLALMALRDVSPLKESRVSEFYKLRNDIAHASREVTPNELAGALPPLTNLVEELLMRELEYGSDGDWTGPGPRGWHPLPWCKPRA